MKKILVVILMILSLGTIIALFKPGLFPIHDDTQVARVLGMSKALGDGMVPVRWVDYLGYNYGYPIFNFYAPLAYYLAGFVALLGFSPIVATKVMMGVGMIGAGITMYLLGTALFSKKAGFIAAIFYLYAPYHALDLYVRGAVGELWAYALLPFPFWGVWKLYQTQKFRYVIATSVGFAAIIIAHNLTALIISPFLLVVAFVLTLRQKGTWPQTYFIPLGVIIGGLLSSFYAFPALLESNYTNVLSVLGGGSNPIDHFVCLSQLWQSPWGFGGSVPGCIDGMSFMLGKLHILGALAGILSSIYFYKKKDTLLLSIVVTLTLSLLLSLFLMVELSAVIWENLTILNFIQFPWRFLVIASFSLSLLVGAVIYAVEKNGKLISTIIAIFLVIGCFFFYSKYFNPQFFITDTDKYTTITEITYTVSKISDEYLPKDFIKPQSALAVPKMFVTALSGQIDDVHITEKTQHKRITLFSSNATVKLNLAYFPAWEIRVDNDKITPKIIHNVYAFPLTNGTHTIDIQFVQTPLEKIANLLSLVGFCVLVLGIIKTRRTKTL